MNIKYPLVVILSLICLTSFAQQQDTITTFHKNSGQKVVLLDSADFMRQIFPDTETKFFVLREYYKTGKLKFASKTSKADVLILEGTTVNYFPSGKKREIATFAEGRKIGDAYAYYPNGKLYKHTKFVTAENGKDLKTLIMSCADSTGKTLATDGNGYYLGYNFDFDRIEEEGNLKDGLHDGKWKGDISTKDTKWFFTEEYDNGKLIAGESVYNEKEKYPYTHRGVPPQFKGGMNEFYKMIGNKMQYPQYARAYNIQGRVLLNFVVDKEGKLTDYKVISSPHEVLTVEALRVLQALPQWIPGVQYGRVVRVNYTLPLVFKL